MASYPGSVKVFSTHVNTSEVVDASHPNALQDEVIAIENTLGTSPTTPTAQTAASSWAQGSAYANIAARLNNIELGIISDSHTQYLRKTSDGSNVVSTGATTNVGIAVNGLTSQTANLQEWRVNNVTVASVTPAGLFSGTIAQTNGTVTTASISLGVIRNIWANTVAPTNTQGADGDIWVQYV